MSLSKPEFKKGILNPIRLLGSKAGLQVLMHSILRIVFGANHKNIIRLAITQNPGSKPYRFFVFVRDIKLHSFFQPVCSLTYLVFVADEPSSWQAGCFGLENLPLHLYLGTGT
jgi:hypothetical protein